MKNSKKNDNNIVLLYVIMFVLWMRGMGLVMVEEERNKERERLRLRRGGWEEGRGGWEEGRGWMGRKGNIWLICVVVS